MAGVVDVVAAVDGVGVTVVVDDWADAFEAMTSERPYRPAMSIEETINEIKRCVGSQFDPMVVTAFLKKIAVINRVD